MNPTKTNYTPKYKPMLRGLQGKVIWNVPYLKEKMAERNMGYYNFSTGSLQGTVFKILQGKNLSGNINTLTSIANELTVSNLWLLLKEVTPELISEYTSQN